MAEDTYSEELYIEEIEILDYDDVYWWGEYDLPDPNEWEGDYYEQVESDDEDYVDRDDWEDWHDY